MNFIPSKMDLKQESDMIWFTFSERSVSSVLSVGKDVEERHLSSVLVGVELVRILGKSIISCRSGPYVDPATQHSTSRCLSQRNACACHANAHNNSVHSGPRRTQVSISWRIGKCVVLYSSPGKKNKPLLHVTMCMTPTNNNETKNTQKSIYDVSPCIYS